MDITLHRYKFVGAKWSLQSFNLDRIVQLKNVMMAQPFQGEDSEAYGFAQVGYTGSIVYGLLVQKYPKLLTDYDVKTKEETRQRVKDSGEYLFIIDFNNFEVYMQSKRSKDLPTNDIIILRFTALLKLSLDKVGTIFDFLETAQDEYDREEIVRIFYEEADEVYALELSEFDPNLVLEEREKRGKIQTYFNPIDEYQPAMQEASIRLATHAEKVSITTKEGQSLKKDPIARAALEGSRKPTKITYKKDLEIITKHAVKRYKEVITIEDDTYDLKGQIDKILPKLMEDEVRKSLEENSSRKEENLDQSSLF